MNQVEHDRIVRNMLVSPLDALWRAKVLLRERRAAVLPALIEFAQKCGKKGPHGIGLVMVAAEVVDLLGAEAAEPMLAQIPWDVVPIEPQDIPLLVAAGPHMERARSLIAGWLDGGSHAEPFLLAALKYGGPELAARADALASADWISPNRLAELRAAGLTVEAERRVIESGVNHADAATAAAFVGPALELDVGEVRERVWGLLGDKRKSVSAAAAEALGTSTMDVVDRAADLLANGPRPVRSAAAAVLRARSDAASRAVLLDRLPNEPEPSVRAEIVGALLDAGVPPKMVADAFGPVDLDDFAERGRGLKKPGWAWLESEAALPPLRTRDGREVDPAAVRLLLVAQSKQARPMPDPELLPLYAMIDRAASGDFALRLLAYQQQSGRGGPTAWALIPVGLLGDNRATAALIAAVRGWAQKYNEKLFTWAVAALALQGSDAALSALGGIADRHRDAGKIKLRKAAAAADAALDKLAAGRGISRAELDDQTVPSFGFPTDGSPRRIEAGKGAIEARIGADFKLTMTHAATGKRAASVPKAAGEAAVAEFKGLRKLLGEVAKQQAARLERLMVAGERWDGAAWSARFLGHPVLLPFAQRLVWAIYENDQPARLFRALPDRTLTDADDEAVDPPAAGERVSLAHPLLLDADALAAWREHLTDYEVAPPFEQLDRPVARVPAELLDATADARLDGAEVGLLALRSKLERLGWAAAYDTYRRRFREAGVTAKLAATGSDGYYGRLDPSITTELGPLTFVASGKSGESGESAVSNERPLPLREVPPMAYSEAAGHLRRIAGAAD